VVDEGLHAVPQRQRALQHIRAELPAVALARADRQDLEAAAVRRFHLHREAGAVFLDKHFFYGHHWSFLNRNDHHGDTEYTEKNN
jgi:hypothetical protein